MPLQRALSIAQPKNEKTPEKGNQVGLSNEQLKAAVGGLSAETLVEIDQDGDGEVDAHEYAAYMRRAEAERQEIEDLASLLSPEELDETFEDIGVTARLQRRRVMFALGLGK